MNTKENTLLKRRTDAEKYTSSLQKQYKTLEIKQRLGQKVQDHELFLSELQNLVSEHQAGLKERNLCKAS